MLKKLIYELSVIYKYSQQNKKLSVTSICDSVGVCRQTYYNWLDGSHLPNPKTVYLLAACFSDLEEEQCEIAKKIWLAIFQDQTAIIKQGGKNGK